MGVKVIVKSDELVCWAQEVKEFLKKLQGLLESMPKSVVATVVDQSNGAVED